MRRGRRALYALVTVLLTTLLALLVGEGVARFLGVGGAVRSHFRPGIYRADPELSWALQPNYRGARLEETAHVPTSTNALGFRGPEWDAARQKAKLRILCLGDSTTFGMGAGDEGTFPAQLETALRERGLSAAVFNAGVPGYGTEQEALLFDRLASVVNPSVVIVAWLPNDALRPFELSRTQVIDGYLVEDVERYLKWRDRIDNRGIRRSALYRFVRVRSRLLRDRFGGRRRSLAAEVDPDLLRACMDGLARIQTRAHALGAETILALLPRREQVEGSLEAPTLSQMAEFGRARGMQVVSPLEAWRSAGVDTGEYFLNDNVHMTARGYGDVARRLADAVAVGPLALGVNAVAPEGQSLETPPLRERHRLVRGGPP